MRWGCVTGLVFGGCAFVGLGCDSIGSLSSGLKKKDKKKHDAGVSLVDGGSGTGADAAAVGTDAAAEVGNDVQDAGADDAQVMPDAAAMPDAGVMPDAAAADAAPTGPPSIS